jgi:mercuric ion transport protein
MSGRQVRLGLAGALVTALCCFTPLLGWALGALGLAWLIGWLDAVLLPLLALFLLIAGVGLWQRHRAR